MSLLLKNKVWQKSSWPAEKGCVYMPLAEASWEGFGLCAGVAEALVSLWELFLVSSITYY